MKMLEGMPIYSRQYEQRVFVSNNKFYEYGPVPAPVLIDEPSEYQVDKLCDDLFYEEFGIEPTKCTVAEMAETLLGDFGNTN